jgi:hypothetical protein
MTEQNEFSDGDLGITERFLCEAATAFEHLGRLYRGTASILRDVLPETRRDLEYELIGVTRRTVLLVFRFAFGRPIEIKEKSPP